MKSIVRYLGLLADFFALLSKIFIRKPFTGNLKVVYTLSISVQKAYETGALEVRIPYELFDTRTGAGKGTIPSQFSLGNEKNPSPSYSFTYRIDNKGTSDTSDDEVVFFNYKPLEASDNCSIQVEYTITPFSVVDCSVGSLTAYGSGTYQGQTEAEQQQSGPITYRLDTGVRLDSATKSLYRLMYYWDEAELGERPDDFDMYQYNYVMYRFYVGYYGGNQPCILRLEDMPDSGGEVWRAYGGSTSNSISKNQQYEVQSQLDWNRHKVSDTDGTLSAMWSTGGQTQTAVSFTNVYTPDCVDVVLPVEKKITGNARPTGEEQSFSFLLTAITADAPLPVQCELTITDAGQASFGAITFAKAGVYCYTLQETPGHEPGYSYDTTPRTVEITVTDENGQLKADWTVDGSQASSIVFENNYNPDDVSVKLPVRKAIEGNVRPTGEEKEFTFTIRAVTENAPMPKTATVTITDAGADAFDEICFDTAGTYLYEIAENAGNANGYQYDQTKHTATVTVTDNNGVLRAEWSIDGKDVTESLFTNRYTPEPAEISIHVSKTITGNSRPQGGEKEFTFTLEAVSDSAPLPDTVTVNITDQGETAFEPMRFTEAGTYQYRVTERNDGENGYTYDASIQTVLVTVTDHDGKLSAVWTVDGVENGKADFTNDYTPTPAKLTIPVSKEIVYVTPPTDKQFQFVLSATDNGPMPVTAVRGSDTTTITGEGDGAFGEITFTEVGEWHYTVKELDGSDTGYTYDQMEYAITVTVTDDNGTLQVSWTANGYAVDELAYTNQYKPVAVEVELPVSKDFTGNDRPEEKQFTFELTALTDNAPMPDKDTTSIIGAGSAKFGAIKYTEIGEWKYSIKERKGSETGYTYDEAVYQVTVTVVDEDGTLKANWVCFDGDGNTAAPVFLNDYTPEAAEVELPVLKTIEGNPTPTDKPFTFRLTAMDGAPMPDEATLTVNGSDRGRFGMIRYNQAGVYNYILAEDAGSDRGYTYDSTEYAIQVTVTDAGGVLKAEWTVNGAEANEVVFTNRYRPDATSVILPVSKTIVGNETPEDKLFRFELTGESNAPMPDDGRDKVEIIGTGIGFFGSIAFDEAGKWSYTVTEIAGNEHGYAYDAAQHKIEITVTDVDGKLNAVWTLDGQPAESIEFTNVYAPDAATLSIPVSKTVEGNTTPEDKAFQFVLTALDNAPMPDDAVNNECRLTIMDSGETPMRSRFTMRSLVRSWIMRIPEPTTIRLPHVSRTSGMWSIGW